MPSAPEAPGETSGAPRSRARYRRILRFAALQLASLWWFELFLPRIGLARLAARTRERRLVGLARAFRALAIELGGLMIKVGQFMSSRLDVLPLEITRELASLQDEVPAVPFARIRALAERELGMPLERAYAFVDEAPLAAASLGQVHAARLLPPDAADMGLAEVVVKVQRPGIDTIVEVDLAALRRIGGWLQRVRAVSSRVDAPALVEEFAKTCHEEIDYLQEAANAERFAENFSGNPIVNVPGVVWERTTRRVLTLAEVAAIKINDVERLRAAGIEPAEVADRFAAVMFDQLFDHGFFHADPHPGNLFVTPAGADGSLVTSTGDDGEGLPAGTPPSAGGTRWRLTFIDFGMMGEVPSSSRAGLRRLLIAAAARDGKGLVDSMLELGALLPSADVAQLEDALTQAFARFGGMGFAELREVDPREFRAFGEEFGNVMRSMPFQLPEDFLLIFRATALTSGLCSSLDPRFNIWESVEPYATKLLRDESGNVVLAFIDQAVATLGVVARLPQRLDRALTRLGDGSTAVATPQLERRVARLERNGRRIVSAILFAGLLVAGVLLRADGTGVGDVLGWVLIAASAVPLLHAVLSGVVGRRRPE